MPTFSIICATYNAAKNIQGFLKSLEAQTCRDFELIIADGSSTDETLLMVKQSNMPFLNIISGKDQGIYDAMNKGVALAKGNWMIFMGADDAFADNQVLENILNKIRNEPLIRLIFGDVIMGVLKPRRFIPKFTSAILRSNTIHHQGAVYHKEVFENFRYNPLYKISSDYELNLMLYLQQTPATYLAFPISIAGEEGVSSQTFKIGYTEEIEIRNRLLKNPVKKLLLNTLTHLRYRIKKHLFN